MKLNKNMNLKFSLVKIRGRLGLIFSFLGSHIKYITPLIDITILLLYV